MAPNSGMNPMQNVAMPVVKSEPGLQRPTSSGPGYVTQSYLGN